MNDLDKEFKSLINRESPESGYCEYITINYHLPAARNYLKSTDKPFLYNWRVEKIKQQCNEFYYQMVYCSDKDKMISALIEIYNIVFIITGNMYSNYLFDIKTFNNYEESFKTFIKFKEIL